MIHIYGQKKKKQAAKTFYPAADEMSVHNKSK